MVFPLTMGVALGSARLQLLLGGWLGALAFHLQPQLRNLPLLETILVPGATGLL